MWINIASCRLLLIGSLEEKFVEYVTVPWRNDYRNCSACYKIFFFIEDVCPTMTSRVFEFIYALFIWFISKDTVHCVFSFSILSVVFC